MLEFDRNTDPATFNGDNGVNTEVTALWQSLVSDPTDPGYAPEHQPQRLAPGSTTSSRSAKTTPATCTSSTSATARAQAISTGNIPPPDWAKSSASRPGAGDADGRSRLGRADISNPTGAPWASAAIPSPRRLAALTRQYHGDRRALRQAARRRRLGRPQQYVAGDIARRQLHLAERVIDGHGRHAGKQSNGDLKHRDGWIQSPYEDLVFSLTLSNGAVVPGAVVYEGNEGNAFARSDLNFDGDVDADDWPIFRDNNLTNLAGLSGAEQYGRGDLNGNGVNDFYDFRVFKTDFDGANGAGAFTAAFGEVPEPAALALAFGGALSISLVRRRRTRR